MCVMGITKFTESFRKDFQKFKLESKCRRTEFKFNLITLHLYYIHHMYLHFKRLFTLEPLQRFYFKFHSEIAFPTHPINMTFPSFRIFCPLFI